MNKFEAKALFKAMKILVRDKNLEGLEEVIDAVLEEIDQGKKHTKKKGEDE